MRFPNPIVLSHILLFLLIACTAEQGPVPPRAQGPEGQQGSEVAPEGPSFGTGDPKAAEREPVDGVLETGGGGSGAGGAPAASPTSPSADGIEDADVVDPPAESVPPAVPSLIGDVSISPASGTFVDELMVEMGTDLPDAEIRYTLDGNPPTVDSPRYEATLSLTATGQVRAQVFVEGAAAGAPSSALYIARTFDTTSDLPLLILDGYGAGKPMDKEVYFDAAFMVFEPEDGTATLSGPPTIATRAGYHIRGQSSARFEKAPYRVELWDNVSEDADYPLLDMPSEADWALVGPYADRTLIRNAFIYSLGREMGMRAPRLAFVETFIHYGDGPLMPDHYEGVYTLVETIKNAENRLDLKQLRSENTALPDITGGYIFKFDWAAAEEPMLLCIGSEPLASNFGGGGRMRPGGGGSGEDPPTGTCWDDLEVTDPNPLMPEQAGWLTEYIQAFHDALHAEPIGDYASYIDVDSFVDLFIVNELSRDIDAFTRSTYYHKDRDGLIVAGPLWDYNFSLNSGVDANRQIAGWQYPQRIAANDWFTILAQEPAFMALVSARWRSLRQGVLSGPEVDARIDGLTAPLTTAAARDHARWPVGEIGNGGFISNPGEPTWEGQVQVMREWIHQRVAWLDGEL